MILAGPVFRELFGRDITEVLPQAVEAWLDSGVATLSDDKLRLAPHGRQMRTRTLLWAVKSSAIEHEIAAHMALDLSPEGLRKLLHPVPLSTTLAEGVILDAVRHGALGLRLPNDDQSWVRIRPPLTDGGHPRLVIVNGPQDERGRRALVKAVTQLQKLINRNHTPWVPD